MPIFTQVTLPAANNLPADNIINTFAFSGGDAGGGTAAQIAEAIMSFYNVPSPGGASSVAEFINSTVSRTVPLTMKMWDTGPGDLGEPVVEFEADTLVAPNETAGLPQEVALCLSYGAGVSSGVPQRRRRGRIYIGPLTESALGPAQTGQPRRPSSTLIAEVLASADYWLGAMGTLNHAVWSRAGNVVTPITSYWIDNEFDTQRRRGQLPSDREVIVVGSSA